MFDIEGIFNKGEKLTPINKILSIYYNYSSFLFEKIKDEYFSKTEKEIYKLLNVLMEEKLLETDYIIISDFIRILNTFFNNNIYLFNDLSDFNKLSKEEVEFKYYQIEKALTNLKEINAKYEKRFNLKKINEKNEKKFNLEYFISFLEEKKEEIEDINTQNKTKEERQNSINC